MTPIDLKELRWQLKRHLENRTYRDYFCKREDLLKHREEFFRVYPEHTEYDRKLVVEWFLRYTFTKGWVCCDGVRVTDLDPNNKTSLNDFKDKL